MAVLYADTGRTPPRTPRFGGLIARCATFTVPAGFVQADDSIQFFTLPANVLLVDISLTKGATGQSLDIGTAEDDDLFFSGVAAGASTTPSRAVSAAGLDTIFTVDTPILGVFNTGNPTAGAIIKLRVSYLLTA